MPKKRKKKRSQASRLGTAGEGQITSDKEAYKGTAKIERTQYRAHTNRERPRNQSEKDGKAKLGEKVEKEPKKKKMNGGK